MVEYVENKLKTDEGLYVGKEFKSDGTYKSGKNEGKPFRRFQIMVKLNEQDQYPRKYTVLDPISAERSLKLDDLREGQRYKVGYNETDYTHPDYGQQKSRLVTFIALPGNNSSPPREEGVTTRNPPENNKGSGEVLSHTSFSLPLPSQPQMEEFNTKYKELIEKRNVQPDFNQYLAVLIRQKYSEQLKDLLEITEKMYAKEFQG